MRRIAAAFAGLTPLLIAAPAAAQSSGSDSGTGSPMLLLAAIAAGVAIFLLIVILFGKNRSTAGVERRLGTDASVSSGGLFAKVGFLRRAARSAESAAQDRGATNMIESALEQANLPWKAGEAIIAIALEDSEEKQRVHL